MTPASGLSVQSHVRAQFEKALPPEMGDQIVGRTDGVPLFIEELTKTVLESGPMGEHRGA